MTRLTPQSIKRQIDELIARLIEFGLCDDQNATLLRRNSRTRFEVTFANAASVSFALKDREYDEIYRELTDARAYNMKLLDGAIAQVMYEFEELVLVRHRLAFFPSPRLRPFQEDSEIYLHDVLFAEIVSRRIVPFPIRFDYDARESSSVEVVHPKCHLTLGQYENCRIPVTAPLTPGWFIDFIIRNFYHTVHLRYANEVHHSLRCFGESILPAERKIVHVAIPKEVAT